MARARCLRGCLGGCAWYVLRSSRECPLQRINRVLTMKITIDSSEPLESAIRVLGAMYDVTLTVATDASSPAPKSKAPGKPASSRASRRGEVAKTAAAAVSSRQPRRASKATANAVSASELRSWARANGYDVSSHGRVPAAVATAYRDAHQN